MQGPKWPFLLILIVYGPCVVIVNLLGQVCTLGRAPCTKETLPDFRESCRVTRYSRVFRGLTSCQWTPRFWGVTRRAEVEESSSSGMLVLMTKMREEMRRRD